MFQMRFHMFNLGIGRTLEYVLFAAAKVRKYLLNADNIFFYTSLPICFTIVILKRF